jgi:outer membrane protein assembly factor BamB
MIKRAATRADAEQRWRSGACGVVLASILSTSCAGAGRTDYSWFDGTRGRPSGSLAVRYSLDLMPEGGGYIPVERAAPGLDPIGGRFYVGSTRGFLWAFDADGRERYRYDAGAAIEAQPVIDPRTGEVYAATVRGTLLALQGESGEAHWKAEAGAAISQPVLLTKDAVYAVTDEDAVLAFARKDGSVLWRYRREAREGFLIAGHAGLALADNRVLAGFDDGAVVALDASDGRVLWETDTSLDLEDMDPTRRFTDVDTTPAVVDDTVYVASFSGGLYGLELATGTVRSHEGQLKGITGITATRDALLLSSAETGVLCLDLPMLSPRWQRKVHGAPGKTEVRDDTVYVAESLGAFLALSLADGRELGRIQTAHGITGQAALSGRRGFVLSNAATLYAFTY